MKNAKVMLVTALLFSASLASAAITTDIIDFEVSPWNVADYAGLTGASNVKLLGTEGTWNNPYGGFGGSNVVQFNFGQATRFESIWLGSSRYTQMSVYGVSGGVDTMLLNNVVASGTTFTFSDPTAEYTGLKITQTTYYGKFDNIVYEFGEEPVPEPEPEPTPTPVPAPGAIILASIGTCVATWIRKRKFA